MNAYLSQEGCTIVRNVNIYFKLVKCDSKRFHGMYNRFFCFLSLNVYHNGVKKISKQSKQIPFYRKGKVDFICSERVAPQPPVISRDEAIHSCLPLLHSYSFSPR